MNFGFILLEIIWFGIHKQFSICTFSRRFWGEMYSLFSYKMNYRYTEHEYKMYELNWLFIFRKKWNKQISFGSAYHILNFKEEDHGSQTTNHTETD